MSTQSVQKAFIMPNSEQPEELSDSSSKWSGLVTDLAFRKDLPISQILSYLGEPSPKPLTNNFPSKPIEEGTLPYSTKTPSVVTITTSHARQSYFTALQKWEGIVLSVEKDSFLVRLIDLTGNNPDEETEFSLEEVSPEDINLIKKGAIFYWSIGYFDSYTGQRERKSILRFRRMPAWSKREIEAANSEAERIADEFGWK